MRRRNRTNLVNIIFSSVYQSIMNRISLYILQTIMVNIDEFCFRFLSSGLWLILLITKKLVFIWRKSILFIRKSIPVLSSARLCHLFVTLNIKDFLNFTSSIYKIWINYLKEKFMSLLSSSRSYYLSLMRFSHSNWNDVNWVLCTSFKNW